MNRMEKQQMTGKERQNEKQQMTGKERQNGKQQMTEAKGRQDMELQKLSSNVNQKANRLVRRIITGLCFLAGVAMMIIISYYIVRDNKENVQLYRSQIDNTMSEKAAFINTVAAGASSQPKGTDYSGYVDSMAELYDDVSAVYVCVEEDDVVYPDGIMTYMSGGWVPDDDFVVSDRDWYQGAEASDDIYVSEPYADEQTGNICITLSKGIYRDGRFVGVAGMDMYMDDLVTLIEGSYHGGNYVFLVSADGTILTHPDSEIALSPENSSSVSEALGGKYRKVCENILKTKIIWDYKGGAKFAVSDRAETTGWTVAAVTPLTGIVTVVVLTLALAAAAGVVLGGLLKKQLTSGISPMFTPLEELAANVSKISDGELDYSFQVDERSREVNALSVALNDTMKGLQHYISEIINTVTAISEKNLDFEVSGDYAGDYEKIKDALSNILVVLNESFAGMNEQAATLLEYSDNLSATSESVADAATQQNDAVQGAAVEMKTLAGNMEKIAETAITIKNNTGVVNDCLALGNREMQDLVAAMDDIVSCYGEIAGFVTEINGIASQTNLLSLNASIEAARAGESGRGFAVVADEISDLSARSSQSSAKISEVIKHSMESVEKGKELVARTDQTISDSAGYSEGNTALVDEIVNFVEIQKRSMDGIAENIKKISEMVENNAASAQENTAISWSLKESAQALMDTIAQFHLKNEQ